MNNPDEVIIFPVSFAYISIFLYFCSTIISERIGYRRTKVNDEARKSDYPHANPIYCHIIAENVNQTKSPTG